MLVGNVAADEEDEEGAVDAVVEVLVPIGSALEAYDVLMVEVRRPVSLLLLLEEEELPTGVVYVGTGEEMLLSSELEVPVGRAEDWLPAGVVVG